MWYKIPYKVIYLYQKKKKNLLESQIKFLWAFEVPTFITLDIHSIFQVASYFISVQKRVTVATWNVYIICLFYQFLYTWWYFDFFWAV